ncbi:MAG: single-stranded DNA-binding protein [Clostridia bacterium]|jgi:single-strand DNA-binding protein|nr:single-stranded DNA-binding protein [Clostridia bacterium]
MLNCAVIMGRLTADPELRQTPSGVAVTRFSVAVDRGYVKAGEERKADFINVVCWRQTAEFVTRYFSKGSMIAVQGSIQTGSYEKDGVKRSTFEIVADNVSFCGSKSESGSNGAPRATETAPSFSNGNVDDFSALADDDDLPF